VRGAIRQLAARSRPQRYTARIGPLRTDAERGFDRLRIRYELRECTVDLTDFSAEIVAARLGLPLNQVFKTLVTRGDPAGSVWLVPASHELEKALARVTGDPECRSRPSQGGSGPDGL
jgi:Cys-tRNA(Pro)/Cys-tRNA(Cys) deacylase